MNRIQSVNLEKRAQGWLHLSLLPRSTADRAFLSCWGKSGQLNTDHYRCIEKCIEDLRAGWYGDAKKEAADYAKLVMHNIKNGKGGIVKDDSISDPIETGLTVKEVRKSALGSTKQVEKRSS